MIPERISFFSKSAYLEDEIVGRNSQYKCSYKLDSLIDLYL